MTRSYALLIGSLAAIWGASYLFIKVAVRDFPPAAMIEIRLGGAGISRFSSSCSWAGAPPSPS